MALMRKSKKTVLVTGGAGFIGSNIAARHMAKGDRVIILDNLSRKGVASNVDWLRSRGAFDLIKGEIRDAASLMRVFKKLRHADVIYHVAAQVAVTTSVTDPRNDFEVNALGTFNVLEAMRACAPKASLIYTSTNKVYGDLAHLPVRETKTRHEFRGKDLGKGVREDMQLDFHSPYGCSKGAADQYVRDYARIYGMRTLVFRQSCIYGTRQIGLEDQGWVAWFLIRAIQEKPVTIYGDGKQVRDILWIDDLLSAYDLALRKIGTLSGRVYNMGGGVRNSISLLEFLDLIEAVTGRPLPYAFAPERPGDQKIFIADTASAKADFGWSPKVGTEEGVRKLHDWLSKNRHVFGG